MSRIPIVTRQAFPPTTRLISTLTWSLQARKHQRCYSWKSSSSSSSSSLLYSQRPLSSKAATGTADFSSLTTNYDDSSNSSSNYNKPMVQWYPGHIAKAERQLSETLKAVDVVVEVRDARICKATAHPRVGEWCAGRPRIVVLTHLDAIPKSAAHAWQKAYQCLGAERWDDAPINKQVANQAQQNRDVQHQYSINDEGDDVLVITSKKSTTQRKKKDPSPVTTVSPVEQVLFVNAKQGEGIHALNRAIFKAGAHVQQRRERRGLNPRALRVGIIGYPNVGKSALINKILGRKRARTANKPGVTRSLQWIRVRPDDVKLSSGSSSSSSSEFELLDSPGIIPARMVDQSDALLLAACNCIGEAAYDNQGVAAYLCEWIKAIHIVKKEQISAPLWRKKCQERYGFDPMKKIAVPQIEMKTSNPVYDYMSGEDMLFQVADNTCMGNPEDAARKIIQDFRAGRMGPISLQLAPETKDDHGQLPLPVGDWNVLLGGGRQSQHDAAEWKRQLRQERAQAALQTAKARGLELPPIVEDPNQSMGETSAEVGKGIFDGW